MFSNDHFYRSMLDHLFDGVYFVDTQRRILYWNQGAARITGFKAEEVMERQCYENILQHVDINGKRLCQGDCPLLHCMQDGQPHQAEVYLHHKDGHRVPILVRSAPLRDETGKIVGAVETFSDNTTLFSALQRLNRLQIEALTDPLTGIGNRRFLDIKMESAVREFQMHNIPFGVVLFDLDHFKKVNDTWGHEAGDRVLRMTAHTLQQNIRASDFLGRWGGEEFLLLLFNLNAAALSATVEKLRILIACSGLETPEGTIRVMASAGATMIQPGDTAQSLFERADALLYKSKEGGRNRITVG
ncbi:MAG: sensor domain-containing diguanylate cyclase [Anaerolineales bacterium]